VATEYGKALLEPSAGVRVLNRRIDAAEMRELIITSGIDLVIDATHPYAVAVSANIREAAAGTGVECLRLIREPMVEGHQGDGGTVEKGRHGDGTVEKSHQARGSVEKGRQEDGSISQADGCEYYADTEGIVRRLNELEGRILLTTGSKDLPAFTAVRDYSRRMYPRVLPALESLQICRELGYELSRVIGMQGPFSEELNIALLRQFDIRVLVTKESGAAGGFAEKVSAARKLGIPVLVLNRPVREQGYTLAELKRELSRRYGQEERGNG
jgi:precorrin-6x reductase